MSVLLDECMPRKPLSIRWKPEPKGPLKMSVTREIVSQDQLHEILNAELHGRDPCGECSFQRPPAQLRVFDDSGCNWSQDFILRYGRRGNTLCAQSALQVISLARARFNLMPHNTEGAEKKHLIDRSLSVAHTTMRSRETYLYFHIDTNRINSRGTLPAMNRLERWRRDGVIGMVISDIARTEAKAGGDARRSRKAIGYIFSLSFKGEPGFQEMQAGIADILFSQGCQSQRDAKDVQIVSNALYYQYNLVTADGVILKNSKALAQLGLQVMTDSDAVALVERAILERDAEAREDAPATGQSLPWWVGQD